MHNQWYYVDRGQLRGPHDAERIKGLVAQGKVPKTIPIWPVGGDPKDAMPADEVMIFTDLPDVFPVIGDEPAKGTLSSHELPPWLDDLRLWMGLEAYAAGKAAAPDSPSGASPELPQIHARPDWLEDWLTPPGPANAVTEEPSEKAAPAEHTPLAYPVNPSHAAGDHAEKGIRETGFDPRSGRILDPDRFRRWKEEKSQPHPNSEDLINRDSMMAAFRDARTAIESWANDEANRLRVLYEDVEEIRNNLQLQAIFVQFARYGPTFQQRIQHHLELIIDKRRRSTQRDGDKPPN